MTKRNTSLLENITARRSNPADVYAYKCRWAPSLANPDETQRIATLLGNDVAVALGGEIEDLETGHHEFRAAIQRVFLRVLTFARQKDEVVLFFNEAVPGYTLMLLKKGADIPSRTGTPDNPSPAPAPFNPAKSSLLDTPEGQAASLMIEAFFGRTHSRAMTIEHPDALFVFFPATDLRRNVREMGFYFVDR